MDKPEIVYKKCPRCLHEKYQVIYDEIDEHREHPIKTKKEYSDLLDKAELDSLFPAQLRTWNRHCPAHQDQFQRDVRHVVINRFIPVDWFDVFDVEGHHVCRACGAKLLTKKGKPHHMLRWCQGSTDEQHAKWQDETLISFARERAAYIYELAEKQIPLIQQQHANLIEKYKMKLYAQRGSSAHWEWGSSIMVMCEKCGILCTDNNAQVHHKKPVCQVNETNVMDIFDHANFECLCNSCHGSSHPWRKKSISKEPIPTGPKYKTLNAWMNSK